LVITVPVIGVLVFIMGLSVGLWWFGLLVLAAYACLLAISLAVAGLVLGVSLVQRIREPHIPWLVALAAGLLVLTVLGLLPSVGALVNVVAVVYGMGALLLLPRQRQEDGRIVPLVSSPGAEAALPEEASVPATDREAPVAIDH
jgi:hypothetical protein